MMIRYVAIITCILLTAQAYSEQTLIDGFNRSNRTLSSDGWGQVEGECSIINGSMGGTNSGTENLCYTPTVYNANMSAFITITTKPEAVDSGLSFFVRFNASTFSGYDIQMTTQSGLDRFRLYRFDNGSFGNQLGSTYYAEVAVGDKFGIVAQGTRLVCYYKPVNGAWIQIIDVTDSTYQAGGRIAFGAYSNVGRYDDLIGGNNLSIPDTVLFQDSFDSHSDWHVPYQANSVIWPTAQTSDFPTGNPTSGPRMIGYSGQESVITGQTNPRISITGGAGRGGTGKGLRMRCEAIYGQNDQHSVWYSDTQTYYTLTSAPGEYGYPEIWIQMWRRHQPNFYSRAGSIKYMHVSHFRGGDLNDWHYNDESDVDHAPLMVIDSVTFDGDLNCCTGSMAYDDLTQDFEPWIMTMFREDPYPQRTDYRPESLIEGIFHHQYIGEVYATPNMTGGWRDTGNFGDGDWHFHEFHLKMNSAPGVADGVYGYYIDGVAQTVLTDVPWIQSGGVMCGWNMVSPGGNQDFHTLTPGGETFYYDIDDLSISTYRLSSQAVNPSHVTVSNSGSHRVISNNGTITTIGN